MLQEDAHHDGSTQNPALADRRRSLSTRIDRPLPFIAPQPCGAVPNHSFFRGRHEQHNHRREAASEQSDGRQLAPTLYRTRNRRAPRRVAFGRAAFDRRRGGRRADPKNVGDPTGRRDALVMPRDGRRDRHLQIPSPTHRERVRDSAPSPTHVQTFHRSVFRGEGPRHRGALSRSARLRGY